MEALSILPGVWVSVHLMLPTLEVKVRVQVLDHSLIPGYVVQTPEVPWEVFGAIHMCSVKDLIQPFSRMFRAPHAVLSGKMCSKGKLPGPASE